MLWIEILSKSKKMTGAGNTAKKYKLMVRGLTCFLFVVVMFCMFNALEGV